MVGALFASAVDRSVRINSKVYTREEMTVVLGVFLADPAWLAFGESMRGVWMQLLLYKGDASSSGGRSRGKSRGNAAIARIG